MSEGRSRHTCPYFKVDDEDGERLGYCRLFDEDIVDFSHCWGCKWRKEHETK